MFFWQDPEDDPNDPRSPKERAMNSALTLDANNIPTGAATPLPARTPYAMPAATPSPMLGQQAAWATAPVGSGLGNFARLLDLPGASPAYATAVPPAAAKPAAPLPAATPDAAGGLLAGALAGAQKEGPPLIDGGTAPTYPGGPGAGWGRNAHPSDYEYTARSGMPVAPRVWTEADLDPTHTLGYTGSLRKAFSGGDTYGYTIPSPNLPLFRADMASRAQGLNFAAEMANSLGRQAFQASENEKDRQLKRDLEEANNQAKKNQSLALLSSPNTPSDIKNIEMTSAKAKGTLSAQEIASLNVSDLLNRAKGLNLQPDSLDYWKYIASNFDPKTMNKADLIRKIQETNVSAPQVSAIADPANARHNVLMHGILGAGRFLFPDKPEDTRARNFARSLLNP